MERPLTTEETCKILDITPRTLYRWRKKKIIQAHGWDFKSLTFNLSEVRALKKRLTGKRD